MGLWNITYLFVIFGIFMPDRVVSIVVKTHNLSKNSSKISVLSVTSRDLPHQNVNSENRILFQIIKGCLWDHAVIFSSRDTYDTEEMLQHVLDPLFFYKTLVTVHEIPNKATDSVTIRKTLERFYYSQRQRNFIWLHPEVGHLISNISSSLQNTNTSSLLPNRVQFLILSHEKNMITLKESLKNAIFDNVALVLLDNGIQTSNDTYTLVWRVHRKREFDQIRYSSSFNKFGQQCKIFPNIKHSLNGKPIVGLAKEHKTQIIKVHDPITGIMRYDGMCVHIFDALAQALNFTYQLVPEPGKDDVMTWADYSDMVADGVVDIGINPWIVSSALNYGHTVGFPLLESSFVAVYRDPKDGEYYSHSKLFTVEVYVCIFISGVATVIMYLIMTKAVSFDNDKHCSEYKQSNKAEKFTNTVVGDDMHACQDESFAENLVTFIDIVECESQTNLSPNGQPSTHMVITVTEDSHTISNNFVHGYENAEHQSSFDNCSNYSVYGWGFCSDLLDNMCNFFGSVFQQGTLPRPHHFSARLLLWSWCLMQVILMAAYTGNMTAGLVRKANHDPFETVEEMVENSDYKWGIEEYNSFISVMRNATPESVVRRLYEGIVRFNRTDPTILASSYEAAMLKVKSEKFVALVHNDYFKAVNLAGDPNLKVLEEDIVSVGLAMIFPRQSEFRDLISEQLIKMKDTGLLDAIIKNMSKNVWNNTDPYIHDGSSKRSVGIHTLYETFLLCACTVTLGFIVLIGECILARVTSKK